MQAAPPGWYRDPGGTPNLRWWTGWQWTGYVTALPAAAGAYWAQSLRDSEQSEARLGPWAARAVLLYVVVAAVGTAIAVASLPSMVAWIRLIFDHPGFPAPSEPGVIAAASLFEVPLELLAAVVFLIWQYQAASTARILGYPARRSPALGVGSWFIPVVNLWFPYQALRDLLPARHRARPLVLRAWICFLLTGLVAVFSELIAFASVGLGVAIGILAVGGWLLAGWWVYRFVQAISSDHGQAVRAI